MFRWSAFRATRPACWGCTFAPGGGEHACYIGDLIPTSAHLDPTWCTGYDLDPLRMIEERRRFYARAIPERWWVLFPHDHDVPAARLTMNERGRPVVAAGLAQGGGNQAR